MFMYMYMYMCMCMCICILCICIRVCMYMYKYMCMYICISLCVCVCTGGVEAHAYLAVRGGRKSICGEEAGGESAGGRVERNSECVFGPECGPILDPLCTLQNVEYGEERSPTDRTFVVEI